MSSALWSDPVPARLPEELREPLSSALDSMAELVRAWNERLGEAEAVQTVEAAIERLDTQELLPSGPHTVLGPTTFTLLRMLALIQRRIASRSA